MNVKMTARIALSLLALLAMACGGGSGKGGWRKGSGSPPSLLFVTIDTWRWDYVGVSGSGKVKTPTLDKLASEGFYQKQVQTPCPLTTPAHATMLTGLLPLHHKVMSVGGYNLAKEVPTITQAFKAKGYSTAAFISSDVLAGKYGLDKGFDLYDENQLVTRGNSDWVGPTRDGALTTASFLERLHSLPPGVPAFFWVHYYDLHAPRRTRPAFNPQYPNDPYAAQVAFVDSQVKILLEAIAADTGRNWRVVIVGDHGEGLGDHHEDYHGSGLYETTLAVPMIIRPKPEEPLKHPAPWGLQDLDPTLRDWFDLPKNPVCDGVDLFGAGPGDRPLPSLTILPSLTYGVNPILGIRKGNYMYMRHGVEELYDLSSDMAELKDLAASEAQSALMEGLRKDCSSAFPDDQLQAVLTPTMKHNSEELANLASLGYVGGPIAKLNDLQKADMRAVIQDSDAFENAREDAFQRGNTKAVLALEPVLLKKYPHAAGLYKNFGLLHMRLGDTKEACDLFDRAVQLNPTDVDALGNLGGLLLAQGQVEKAQVVLESGLAIDESDAVIRKDLGILYSDYLDDPARSLPHYKRYLELRPNATDAAQIKDYIARMEKKYGTGAPAKKP